MGFRPATMDEVVYILVPGYGGRSQAFLAASPQAFVEAAPVLSPAFTQSLLDWIKQQVALPVASLGNPQP